MPARRRRYGGRLDKFQWPRFQRFIFDVQPRQFLPGFRESPEILRERNARQFALQVLGVFRPVFRMVQNPVDVIEDVPLGDFLVTVLLAEMLQRPGVDVLVGIWRTRATSGSSRQIEWQIANVTKSSPPYKSIKHLFLIFVT